MYQIVEGISEHSITQFIHNVVFVTEECIILECNQYLQKLQQIFILGLQLKPNVVKYV